MSGFPSLNPGGSSATTINYSVATNVPLGTQVVFNDTTTSAAPLATSWLTDNTPWNNVDNHNVYVVGSYDPNFKEVSPQGTGPNGDIFTTDTVLTYVVHFQNTGSYYAQNIKVVDTLDANLRITTLKPGYSPKSYSTSMTENGVATFTFKNINLPWQSGYGDEMSSSFFTYSIKLKKNLPLGTKIRNKAAIYFDFNEPIITNTTLNTIAKQGPTGIAETKRISAYELLLYPNPASNQFVLAVISEKDTRAILSVYDINGREISAREVELQAGDNLLSENAAQLQNGIYFVKLNMGSRSVSSKLVITK
jgi:uncharacterized repeat protein (TIGR01451 family)